MSIPIVCSFFFSSRRRHTRCGRDWSSDVCSSDLSLAHADPAAELPAVMLALDAKLQVRGPAPRGVRSIPAGEFYTGLFETALAPGELLVDVAVPRAAPRSGSAFAEVARRHGDYALAGVAVRVTVDDAGRCREARIALLSLGRRPGPARKAAKALTRESPHPA